MHIVRAKQLIAILFSISFYCYSITMPASSERKTNNLEKKITVIISAYNNSSSYECTLESILAQEYTNYHIIYIDDASTDNTPHLVAQYRAKHCLQNTLTLIKNAYPRKGLSNLYRAVQLCNPQDIIIALQNNEYLTNPTIFKDINALSEEVWFIDTLGSSNAIFYAWLAQEVKLENLIPSSPHSGGKIIATNDLTALLNPLSIMADKHRLHVPVNWIQDMPSCALAEKDLSNITLDPASYLPLKEKPLFQSDSFTDIYCPIPCADVIIVSTDPQRLENYLMALHIFTIDIGTIYILHDQDQIQEHRSPRLFNQSTQYVPYNKSSSAQGADSLIQRIGQVVDQAKEYLLISDDTHHLKKPLSLTSCLHELFRTKAESWFLSLSLKSFGNPKLLEHLPCEQLNEDMYAWKYSCFTPAAHQLIAGIHSKQNLIQALKKTTECSLEQLAMQLHAQHMQSVGLFFEHAIINERSSTVDLL